MTAGDLLPLQQWIARELHDVVVQPLTSTMVELDLAQHEPAGLPADRAQALQRELRGVLQGLRLMMSQLRGDIVDPENLVPRLTALIADVCQGTGLDASLLVSPGWPVRLAPETGRNLHRIIEEALRNAIRHSGASAMEVRLEDFPGGLRVSITDNGGSGPDRFDPASEGMGTRGMHERAVVIGGVLTIDHARSGSTVVVVVDEACPELVA